MRLPLINIPVAYHVGTLDKSRRGERFAASYEGYGLSVSLCPDAWRAIAKLGADPVNALSRHDALYLDVLQLGETERMAILRWASEQGLVETREIWRSYQWDSEVEDWTYSTHPTREAALAELLVWADIEGDPSDLDAALEQAAAAVQEEFGVEPTGPLVSPKPMPVLTAKSDRRALGFGRDIDAFDMAAMFWAEDVLRREVPSMVGVWWRETFDPDSLSAPRGAILPRCIAAMVVEQPRQVDDDEGLLEAMPDTRLLSPEDLRSPYEYVTNCVQSSADLITPMVDCPASRELSFKEFLAEIGGARAGRQLLDQVFPFYKASGMDIEKDWAVRYRASQFDGMPCVFVVHSAVEYVFQRRGLRYATVLSPVAGDVEGPGNREADEAASIRP